MSTQLEDILQLSVSERIQLAEDIWDSIAANPEALPLSDADRQELDRRLESYARNPDEGVPWDDLKKRVRKSA
jgi:putative addiction module component (TIGR02574 family)